MPIQILPPDVADKIAAGEVVERPASVVKELIENSLDAGATDIRVEIADGGKRLIRVIDNGRGIPAAEAPLAFQRHATSKIRSAEELERIATLGFRGEALAAISAVSKVTLITRSREEPVGVELKLEGSKIISQRPMGAPPGTSLTVAHLFWNTPARKKFLKSNATEAGHISKIVTRYALAYPEVRFSYVAEGRLTFQTPGTGDRMAALVKVYGAEVAGQMLAVDATSDPVTPDVRVSGFVSAPTLHRANRSYIELFVNRRYIQDRNLTFAVVQAYHTLLMTGRYPVAVLFIDMPSELVDVNVHPTKTEVRFREPSLLFRAVQRTVHRALQGQAPVTRELQPPPSPEDYRGQWAARREALMRAGQHDPAPGQLAMDLYRSDLASREEETPLVRREEAAPPPSTSPPGHRLPPLRPVGQIAATYLIAEGPDGMYLIDQHAAHERILYEKIMKADQQPMPKQQLLQPIPIELGTELAGLIAEHLDALTKSGFEIEPFGEGSYLLRTVPAFMGHQDPQALLEEVAEGLARRADLVDKAREEALVTMICKRLAIKAGQILSVAEQRELIRQLEACENPRTCPHGRPTMLHLSAAALEKQFGRLGA
ncbi:MAG TPA: DNA mismatch repair endonuclease MutL [Anaerolineae bacterium]|nr:DNA mismatch repair endonuclease MutL [Anaerolineae bacterium]